MSEKKKFQVFISSTYLDLKDERRAVEETIIRSGDFPVGMEAFPAADEEQFDFIKSVIIDCDYYVLVVAGRYGSVSPDGKSYTEKEYHFAVENEIPVLVLLHGDRANLPDQKVEKDPENQQRLENFIDQISSGRLRKEWTTTDGLKLAVREALDHAKATKQRPGWIRGNTAAASEVLFELSESRKTVASLKEKLTDLRPSGELPFDPAGLDAEIIASVYGKRKSGGGSSQKYTWEVPALLDEIFSKLSPHLLDSMNEASVRSTIGELLRTEPTYGSYVEGSSYIVEETLLEIRVQLEAVGLLKVNYSKTTRGGFANFWTLTKKGIQEMRLRRVIPK